MTFLERDLDFGGRRVLVTGGANGLGAAMAQGFAKSGAHVLIADIEEANASRLAGEIGNAEALGYDQSDPHSVRRLAERAGAVDVLVNNAGILLAKPLLDCAWEDIRRLVDIDFLGVVLLTQLIGRGWSSDGAASSSTSPRRWRSAAAKGARCMRRRRRPSRS